MDQASTMNAALIQLAFLGAYGLLLTPEPMAIPANPNAPKSAGMKSEFSQCRASFTLIDRSDLWTPGATTQFRVEGKSHADLFGAYAIGIDAVDAREFGVAPVSYYYSGLEAQNRTHELLFRLRELHNLCSLLALVESRIGAKDAISKCDLLRRDLFPRGVDDAVARIEAADQEALRNFHDLIDTDRPAAWRLADNLEILFDTFQTADSNTSIGSLAYYEQREWRITRAFGDHLDVRSLGPPDEDTKSKIRSFDDRQALRDVLSSSDGYFTDERLDACVVVAGTSERRFFDFVREVIAPAGSPADRVGAWLDKFAGVFVSSACNKGAHVVFERRDT